MKYKVSLTVSNDIRLIMWKNSLMRMAMTTASVRMRVRMRMGVTMRFVVTGAIIVSMGMSMRTMRVPVVRSSMGVTVVFVTVTVTVAVAMTMAMIFIALVVVMIKSCQELHSKLGPWDFCQELSLERLERFLTAHKLMGGPHLLLTFFIAKAHKVALCALQIRLLEARPASTQCGLNTINEHMDIRLQQKDKKGEQS